MTMIQLPAYVELPWWLYTSTQYDVRANDWMSDPWGGPCWFNAWEGRPFICPWDGATLEIETYANYSYGYECPEPAYSGYCPLCETEFVL